MTRTSGHLPKSEATGAVQTYEKEFFRKDGSRVPVLLGAVPFRGAMDQSAAFVVDLTERKRAEALARGSERRYHEIQSRNGARQPSRGHRTNVGGDRP